MVPPTAALAGFTYVTYRAFCPHGRPAARVNPAILKTSNKVVDTIDVEDISEKAVFCRCWRSKNVSSGSTVFGGFCFSYVITVLLCKLFVCVTVNFLYFVNKYKKLCFNKFSGH